MTIIDESLVEFTQTEFSDVPSSDWLFFYSKNGVKFFFEGLARFDIPIKDIEHKKWAAMGKGTATALKKYIARIDFVGTGQPKATTKAFYKIVAPQKVLFIRANQSKMSVQKLLVDQLEMEDLVVYNNTVKANFSIPPCSILVFTSPLNAQAYFQKYTFQKEQKVIAIGKTTATALYNLGISEVVIAKKPSEKAMAKAVLAHL